MQHDSEQIDTLLDDSKMEEPLSYSEINRRYINDLNGGVYNGRRVEFDTLNLMSDYRVLSEQYVQFSIAVQSVGGAGIAPFDGTEDICLKNGIAGIFESSLIRWNNVTVAQDRDFRKVSILRHLLQDSKQRAESAVQETGFSPDAAFRPTADTITPDPLYANVGVRGLSRMDDAIRAAPGDGYNAGGFERSRQVDSFFNAGVWTFTVRVPMSEITGVYGAYDMPIVNLREQITLTLAPASQVFLLNQKDQAGADAEKLVSYVDAKAIVAQSAKLYYSAVKLDARSTLMFNEKVKSGSYRISKTYLGHKQFTYTGQPNGVIASSATGLDFPITATINKPKRVSLYLTPTAAHQASTTANSVPANTNPDQSSSPYYSEAPTGSLLGGLNLILDNEPFLERDISDATDAYYYVKQQLMSSDSDPRTSSAWSQQLFETYWRVPCFDISRSEKSKRTIAIRARVSQQNAVHKGVIVTDAATPCKLEAVVEYEGSCSMDLVTGKVVSVHQ